MIPEAKAKELFSKFEKLVIMTNGDSWTYEAKECALIAVDEIISVLENISLMESGTTKIDYGQKYWQEVKQEIEKIK